MRKRLSQTMKSSKEKNGPCRDQYSLLLWVFVIACNYLILNIQYTELYIFGVAFSLFIKSIKLDGHVFLWSIIFIWLISVFFLLCAICLYKSKNLFYIYMCLFDHLFGIWGFLLNASFMNPSIEHHLS